MKKLLLCLLISLSFVSCVERSNYFNSHIALSQETKSQKINLAPIALDMANFLKTYFRANQTTFFVSSSDRNKKFYEYVINDLRNAGFAISNTKREGADYLSYTIQNLDKNTLLVNYNINESRVNRIYKIKEDATLEGTHAITTFNFDLKKLDA